MVYLALHVQTVLPFTPPRLPSRLRTETHNERHYECRRRPTAEVLLAIRSAPSQNDVDNERPRLPALQP